MTTTQLEYTDEQLDQIDEEDIIDKFTNNLTPIELYFLERTDAHDLNTCAKCNVIKNTWDPYEGLSWDCDHDLKGYTALCPDCYFELGCKSLYDDENE